MTVEYYRGEGGVVWAFTTPLPDAAADQVRRGKLVAVEPPSDDDDRNRAGMPVAAQRPAATDPKSMWTEWAVASGLPAGEVRNMTKAELVAMFSGEDVNDG